MINSVLLNNKTVGDSQSGYLTFFEAMKDVPFEVKRVYYVHGVPKGITRGKHAHKKLEQLLWCPYGKIEVVLDNGSERQSFVLDDPAKALLVSKGYWHEMIWRQENSVLCVAASDYYDEDDYIRDYDVFLDYVSKGVWNFEG